MHNKTYCAYCVAYLVVKHLLQQQKDTKIALQVVSLGSNRRQGKKFSLVNNFTQVSSDCNCCYKIQIAIIIIIIIIINNKTTIYKAQ